MRRLLATTLGSDAFMWLGDRYYPNRVPIFMLHRFACPEIGLDGHDVSLLRFALEYLRRRRFNFVSVEDILTAMLNGEPLPRRSIAFSIDDGFWDHAEVPGLLFASYDCPTTYFVATGFISGSLWLWDSKVDYLVHSASAKELDALGVLFPHLRLEGRPLADMSSAIVFELARHNSRRIAEQLDAMQHALQRPIPERAPDKYRAISWSRLQSLERMGMRIAPHSYSHPILSNEDDDVARWEIEKSRDDLQSQMHDPSKVFCYPVGRDVDFGEREEDYVQKAGFIGAVSALPGAVDLASIEHRFALPRFAFPDNQADIVQYATWIESFKDDLRNRYTAV